MVMPMPTLPGMDSGGMKRTQPPEQHEDDGGDECLDSEHWCTVQYITLQYSTVQYSTVQYSTVQYSTVQLVGSSREQRTCSSSVPVK